MIAGGWGEGSRAHVSGVEDGREVLDWLCFTGYIQNKA